MKKRIHILLAALLMAMAIPTQAQIVTMDDEENLRAPGDLGDWGRIPNHGVEYDQYNQLAPIGEGLFVLAALGGAYLIGKKRKEEQ